MSKQPTFNDAAKKPEVTHFMLDTSGNKPVKIGQNKASGEQFEYTHMVRDSDSLGNPDYACDKNKVVASMPIRDFENAGLLAVKAWLLHDADGVADGSKTERTAKVKNEDGSIGTVKYTDATVKRSDLSSAGNLNASIAWKGVAADTNVYNTKLGKTPAPAGLNS